MRKVIIMFALAMGIVTANAQENVTVGEKTEVNRRTKREQRQARLTMPRKEEESKANNRP